MTLGERMDVTSTATTSERVSRGLAGGGEEGGARLNAMRIIVTPKRHTTRAAHIGHGHGHGRNHTHGPIMAAAPRSQTPPRGTRSHRRAAHARARGHALSLPLVHDESSKSVEAGGVLHRLGEEIREVVVRVDEGYLDLEGLDHVADEEVAPLHVLHAIVVLRVVRDVARGLRVGRDHVGGTCRSRR